MYHVPRRRKAININPWPVAIRRLLWIIALLCGVAFLQSALLWAADHFLADGKTPFNTPSLVWLVPAVAIAAYLLLRKDGQETWDDMGSQIRMFMANLVFSGIAVYLLWERLEFHDMFVQESESSYPYPYAGTIKLMAIWFSILMSLQMLGTLIVAILDTRGNVYEKDDDLL